MNNAFQSDNKRGKNRKPKQNKTIQSKVTSITSSLNKRVNPVVTSGCYLPPTYSTMA